MEIREIIMLALWILFPLCGFFAWFFWHRARHRERMMMIEKGFPLHEMPKEPRAYKGVLEKVGIIAIGLGSGLAVISILIILDLRKIVNSGPAPVAILVICTGMALLLANRKGKG